VKTLSAMSASNKNIALVLLALTSIAGSAIAWREYQELVRLRATVRANDQGALLRRLAAAEARARALEDQRAAQHTSEQVASDGDVAPPARRMGGPGDRPFPGRGPGGRGGRGDLRALSDDPVAQRLMQQQQKLALDNRFAALFKRLNLPADQLESFKTLLLEKQSAAQDVMAAAASQGLDPRNNGAEIRKMIASAQAETDGSLKALLGTEGFSQYEQFQQTQPQRSLVNQLQQSLSYTAAPLSTTQADQLIQILAANAPTVPADGNAPVFGRGNPPFDGGGRGGIGGAALTITPAAVTAAQAVLSAPQVVALQQLQAAQQAQQQLNQQMRAGRGEGGGPRGG
jgi:hypothetical protein